MQQRCHVNTAQVHLPHPLSQPLVGEADRTVAALKHEGDGELVVPASLALVRALTAAGLVDTFVLTTIPTVLGSGRGPALDRTDGTALTCPDLLVHPGLRIDDLLQTQTMRRHDPDPGVPHTGTLHLLWPFEGP